MTTPESKLLDVTAEQAMRQSEEKYRTLFNSIDEGFCIIEMIYDEAGKPVDYRFIETNKVFERQTGFVGQGKTIIELVGKLEPIWFERYDRVVKTGESIRFEDYTASVDGWYNIFASRVGGDGSRQLAVIFDDITERKRSERNLAFLVDLEKQFTNLTSSEEITKIAGASIGEYFKISHCIFVDINEQMSVASVFHDHGASTELPSLVGDYALENFHTKAEIEQLNAGKPVVVNDVLEGRNPPDSGAKFDALGTRAFVTAPYVRDGRWRFALGAQVNQSRVWRKDEIEFLTELATRVALRLESARAEEALRASEEKYRTLFDSMDQGYCIIEMLYEDGKPVDWRYVAANPAFEKLTGLYNAIGRTIREMAPSIEHKWMEVYGRVAETGESRQFEENSPALDGRIFDLYAFRVGIPEDRNVGVLFTNITERKRLENQKDEFIGIASHELKTPVTSIKAYAQVLEHRFQKENDTQSAELVSKMDAQLDKLTHLIEDLLDVTKIEGGILQFSDEIFDFNGLVNEIIEEMQRTTEKHSIVTELESTKNVYGDRARIGQVLTNLISNAIKYSPQSEKIIVRTKAGNDQVTLTVEDSGIGINKDNLEKVFGRYYRAGTEKQETYAGLGLGLYIASEIIRRQGGKIWVESEKDKGSTFSFSLPIVHDIK